MNVKVGMLEGGVIPPFLHRSASWNLNAREGRRMEVFGVTKVVDEKIDKGVLRWLGNVENDRIAVRVYIG